MSARGETCVAALRKTEKFWNALTPAQRKARAAETILERTKRNRRETGLGISDCDLLGEDMFGWCWCVDDAPASGWRSGRARSSRRGGTSQNAARGRRGVARRRCGAARADAGVVARPTSACAKCALCVIDGRAKNLACRHTSSSSPAPAPPGGMPAHGSTA